jgi:hypothetical protein
VCLTWSDVASGRLPGLRELKQASPVWLSTMIAEHHDQKDIYKNTTTSHPSSHDRARAVLER